MNNIGMLIDVSHISDDAFYQVMALSKTPVIASHSSLRNKHSEPLIIFSTIRHQSLANDSRTAVYLCDHEQTGAKSHFL